MALFTGSGTLVLQGATARIHDVNFQAAGGGVRLSGEAQDARNINGPLDVTGRLVLVADSIVRVGTWSGTNGQISDSLVTTSLTVTGDRTRVQGVYFERGFGLIHNASHGLIQGNTFFEQGAFVGPVADGVALGGDRNMVSGNRFTPQTAFLDTNSAVNVVGGDCNQIVGNDLGDPADYVTAPIIDGGTNTQLYFPNDFTYGDNFTLCETDSS